MNFSQVSILRQCKSSVCKPDLQLSATLTLLEYVFHYWIAKKSKFWSQQYEGCFERFSSCRRRILSQYRFDQSRRRGLPSRGSHSAAVRSHVHKFDDRLRGNQIKK